jgi:hypothetical protein
MRGQRLDQNTETRDLAVSDDGPFPFFVRF